MTQAERLRNLRRIERFLTATQEGRARCIGCDAYSGHGRACRWKAAQDAFVALASEAQMAGVKEAERATQRRSATRAVPSSG